MEIQNGVRIWFNKDGQVHREDGPAMEHPSGQREWWIKGELHREDYGPTIENGNYQEWWQNGHLHREDGPATTYENGQREWWINGNLHRIDGPAIELNAYGYKDRYFIDGEEITKEEFLERHG